MTDTALQTVDPKILAPLIEAQMGKLKEDLARSLGVGNSRYGKSGPDSWDRLVEDGARMGVEQAKPLVEQAKAEIRAEFEAKEKAKAEAYVNQTKMTAAQEEAEYSRISQEWQEAVADGVLPDIAPEIKEKLNTGKQYNDLTDEEKSDEGIQAWVQMRQVYGQLKSQGRASSFYRTARKFYNQIPAGAHAPVLGGSAAVPQKSKELQYADVVENRKKRYRF